MRPLRNSDSAHPPMAEIGEGDDGAVADAQQLLEHRRGLRVACRVCDRMT